MVDGDGERYTNDAQCLADVARVLECGLDDEERQVKMTFGWVGDSQGSANLTEHVARRMLAWIKDQAKS